VCTWLWKNKSKKLRYIISGSLIYTSYIFLAWVLPAQIEYLFIVLHSCIRCLQSLLEQTCSKFEVICVLNGCSDASEAACQSFVEKFWDRGVVLKIVVLAESGLVPALRSGIAVAKADYICRMDVDDVVLSPDRLCHQVEYLDANPDINVVGTQSLLAGDLAHALSVMNVNVEPPVNGLAAGIPTHPTVVQWEMMFRCVILHPTVMFRKCVIECCGGYSDEVDGCGTSCVEDYDLWTRVLLRFPFSIANLAHVDMCIFQHADSKSVIESERAKSERINAQWCLVKPLLQRLTTSPSLVMSDAEAFSIFSRINNPEQISSVREIKDTCRIIQSVYEQFLESIPPSCLGEDVLSMVKASKIKIATIFLCKCFVNFAAENFEKELVLLEISPALLLKYQVSLHCK